MGICINFTDGSKSYVKTGMTPFQFRMELRSWKRDYKLEGFINGGIYYVTAEPKILHSVGI